MEYFWSVQGFCTLYNDQEDRIQIHFPFMNVRQPGDDKCVTQAAVFFSYNLHAVAVAASEPSHIRLFQEVID